MLQLVTTENATASNVAYGKFFIDASELQLQPGHWPTTLKTTLGNGCDLALVELDEYGAVYKQLVGCVVLAVLAS